MAAALEYMVGVLTAVCTSLVVVLMILWRLLRLRARPPPHDVTDVVAWLLDAGHAAMGAAILALVAGIGGAGGVTCAVAWLTALLASAQTLGVLAARAVVTTTGHVVRGSRDAKARCDAADVRWRCGRSAASITVQLCLVTVLCAWHSQHAGTPAWCYSFFLLVVSLLPLGAVRQLRGPQHPAVGRWTVVVLLLLIVKLLATLGDWALQAALALTVDLVHLYVQLTLDATQCCQLQCPLACLTAISRAAPQPVILAQHTK